jgi:DNA-binding IclR family transcriptional regulator
MKTRVPRSRSHRLLWPSILAEAERVYLERGGRIVLAEVARRLGISKDTVYAEVKAMRAEGAWPEDDREARAYEGA